MSFFLVTSLTFILRVMTALWSEGQGRGDDRTEATAWERRQGRGSRRGCVSSLWYLFFFPFYLTLLTLFTDRLVHVVLAPRTITTSHRHHHYHTWQPSDDNDHDCVSTRSPTAGATVAGTFFLYFFYYSTTNDLQIPTTTIAPRNGNASHDDGPRAPQ